MDAIRSRAFAEPDRQALRERLAAAITADPEPFIVRYRAHPFSRDGRFINSDLLKETFPEYAQSRAHRARYDLVVHDCAAVLAAEQFRRAIAEPVRGSADVAVFLTGCPGAGKTTRLMHEGFQTDWHLVLEGQLATQGIDKVASAIAQGLQPLIVVVHSSPELALDNAIRRFEEVGRGATVEAIASILGRLPDGLKAIQDRFGESVGLVIIDNRDRSRASSHHGWSQVYRLSSEGDYAGIHNRVRAHLERRYRAGDIGQDAYDHALGRPGPPIQNL